MTGFRHVVMFTWTDDVSEEQQRTLVERLSALPGLIPEIRAYDFGPDAGVNPGNRDFVVVADFDDRAGYLTYRDHPSHRAVIEECITPIVASRSAVQYELSG